MSFSKIHQIQEGDLIASGNNSAEQLNHLVPPSVFNFRNLKDRNSLLFITFQRILPDSAVLLSRFRIFFKLKRGDVICWGEPILQKSGIIWSPLLCFNFRSLKGPISLPFITFQCILLDSAVLF